MICRKGPRRMFCVANFLPTRHPSVMLNCLVDTFAIAAVLQLRFCEDSFCINNWNKRIKDPVAALGTALRRVETGEDLEAASRFS